jgi:hypothetical protein
VDAERAEDEETWAEAFSNWFGAYVIAPVQVGVGMAAGLIVWFADVSFALVEVVIGLPLVLFALPYKNRLQELGLALALIASGWFGMLAVGPDWSRGYVALGVLVLVVGLLLVGVGHVRNCDYQRRRFRRNLSE